MKLKSKMLGLLVAALMAVPVAANATPIVNGGFETGDLTGWTCTGADLCDAATFAPRTGSFGLWGFDNSGFATLSQTTATNIGETYDFSFYSFTNISSAGNVLRYQIGGGPIVGVLQTGAYALTTTSFVAGAASTSINLYFETDGGTGTWQIDDISVTSAASAVPEPATVTLLGLGIAGLVAQRLRRRRA